MRIFAEKYIKLLLYLTLFVFVNGCDDNDLIGKIEMENKIIKFEDTLLTNLKSKKILFGHASVGLNILKGLNDVINANPELHDLKVYEIVESTEVKLPGIYHFINRQNGFPKIKCDNFFNFLEKENLGTKFDIVFFKFCYVDFEKNTNVNEIFEYYKNTINEIKKEFPNLKIVHVTVPLYAYGFSFKSKMKNIILADYANIQRNRFNDLLRNAYKNNNTLYDLAAVESTYPNGQREIFTYKDEKFFALIKKYTYDGGHLNEVGSLLAAKELLKILVDI